MDNHVVLFSDNEVRNEFIRSFNMSHFKQKEVAAFTGLSRNYVTFIINNVDREARNPRVDITCPVCGETRKVNKYSVKHLKTERCVKCVQDSYRTGEIYRSIIIKPCSSCRKDYETRRNTWKKGSGLCPSCRNAKANKEKYGYGNASKRSLFNSYRTAAKRRGFDFKIKFDEFLKITQQNCFYCNEPPTNKRRSDTNNGDYIYNGIDRVDNNQGYISGNIVPCCKYCNIAKRDHTKTDFLNWIEKVYKHSFAETKSESESKVVE